MIDKIRDTCLDNLENTYASRLEVLVDEDRYDDARAIVSEMVVDDAEELEWTFIDDMSQFTDVTFHIYIGQKVSKDKRVSQHITDPLKSTLSF